MLNQRAAAHDLFLFSLVESTCEADLAPFWADKTETPCQCATCVQARQECELDRYYAQELADHLERYEAERVAWNLEAEALAWCPAPAVVLTGRVISVEWEDLDRGGRHWVTMDEGELAFECWQMRQLGYGLSDVDEPAH